MDIGATTTAVNERQRVRMLQALFSEGLATIDAAGAVTVGIGDDAAVVHPGPDPVVVSTDAQVEGVHFRSDWMDRRAIGYRATMAALSDLAAMGAAPLGLVSALILPASFDDGALRELALGQRQAAAAVGTAVIGGNLTRGAELSITTTVFGVVAHPLLRSGARPGDVLAVVGSLGLARAGLLALSSERPSSPVLAPALAAYRVPTAHIAAGKVLAPVAHACIDVSDGIALDAKRLAEESDVAVVLEAEALLTPELELAAGAIGEPPVTLALEGGDDYALLVALAPDAFDTVVTQPPLRRVGRIETGEGLWIDETDDADAERVEIEAGVGYDHFDPEGD
ncbi:MAG: thiamine-phosphate kinase [Myxococcota bacterium]